VELRKRVIVALFERLKFWWERFRFEGSLYFQRRRLLSVHATSSTSWRMQSMKGSPSTIRRYSPPPPRRNEARPNLIATDITWVSSGLPLIGPDQCPLGSALPRLSRGAFAARLATGMRHVPRWV